MRILGAHDLPDEVQTFLEAGDPPIIFTSGTAMRHDHDFFAASVAACRRIDVRGLLLTRYPEQIPNVLPGGVRIFLMYHFPIYFLVQQRWFTMAVSARGLYS
ncbi:MAG: hypothetical protein VX603_01520 [Gemmatimonadota bacterium]|nr:hypothetical protein [Gemmatimonadota bacterium]